MSSASAKRLRGWKLQEEQFKAAVREDPDEQNHSALATKLLTLWASGALSASAAQELAHLAILDGAQHEELDKLAGCGSRGFFSKATYTEIC